MPRDRVKTSKKNIIFFILERIRHNLPANIVTIYKSSNYTRFQIVQSQAFAPYFEIELRLTVILDTGKILFIFNNSKNIDILLAIASFFANQ